MEPFYHDIDFLKDDKFIEWRLFLTDDLEEYWTHYIEEFPECAQTMNEAIRKFKSVKLNNGKLSELTQAVLYQRIVGKIQRKARMRRIRYWSAMAAGIALLVVSSWVFLGDNQPDVSDPEIVEAFIGQPLPSDEIQLISGENVVELGQNAKIDLSGDGKASVVQEDANTTELTLAENTLSRLIVPYGKRTTVQLADGTNVWVNSGTELEFPSKFDGKTREITVKGEIYIEVARAEDKPFYVNTDHFRVRVFGTKFNISAYPECNEKSVVLVEGSVEVNADNYDAMMLVPGEMYSITPSETGKTKVDVATYTSWKDGVLIFDKTPMSEVLEKIGRYYNINFEDHSDARLSAKSCTGKLLLSENFDEVMTSVSAISSTIYYMEDGVVYLKNR